MLEFVKIYLPIWDFLHFIDGKSAMTVMPEIPLSTIVGNTRFTGHGPSPSFVKDCTATQAQHLQVDLLLVVW